MKQIVVFFLTCALLFAQLPGENKKTTTSTKKSSFYRFMSPELRKLRNEMGILRAKEAIAKYKHRLKVAKESNRLYELSLKQKLKSTQMKLELADTTRQLRKIELETKLQRARLQRDLSRREKAVAIALT